LAGFQLGLDNPGESSLSPVYADSRQVAHRRMAFLKGQ
jgi:hypothetical protein